MLKKILLAYALCSCAGRQISYKDILMESLFTAETVIDWGQTNTIITHCGEQNPIIGHCGENMQTGLYFPTIIAIHWIMSMIIPDAWISTVFQGVSVGLEGKTIYRNYTLGDTPTW